MTSFTLIPFDKNTASAIAITGEIQHQDNQLTIKYQLIGTSNIIVPHKADLPLREFDLWEHTCCEFFLGLKGDSKYWEFNLSPAGHWNVFRFLEYRQNIAEETAFDTLPFQVMQQNDYVQVSLNIDLSKIIKPEQSIEVGVTAVVEDRQNQLSYWALNHPGKEADFHLRDSFTIALS